MHMNFYVVKDTQTGVTAFSNRRVYWEASIQTIDVISHNTEIIRISPQPLWAEIICLRHCYDIIVWIRGPTFDFDCR